jgi:hypothetical protein
MEKLKTGIKFLNSRQENQKNEGHDEKKWKKLLPLGGVWRTPFKGGFRLSRCKFHRELFASNFC